MAKSRPQTMGRIEALVANALVLLVLTYAWAIEKWSEDFYYRSLQEDEYLEWGTFWGFILAAVFAFVAGVRQRRETGQLPWFLFGVGLFCFVVAMEEISWAQRVLGYRPPSYFLANNFQQELNIHNVMDSDLRKLLLKVTILGYGVVLAIAGRIPEVRGWLDRLGIVAPPVALAPAFFVTYWVYESYPWSFAGEVVELMLALCFLFALLEAARRFGGEAMGVGGLKSPAAALVGGWALVMVLGLATAAMSRAQRGGHPGNMEAAEKETELLRRDFIAMARERGKLATKCGLHKRVFSYLEKYDEEYLLEGEFASMVLQGLPEERAAFFIDPWNTAYWIRHECRKREGITRVFVYSFGPNRKRESSDLEIRGDDIGAMIASTGNLD